MLTIISATPVLVVRGGLESEVCTVTFSAGVGQSLDALTIKVLNDRGTAADPLIEATTFPPTGNEVKVVFKASADAIVTKVGAPRKISFSRGNGVECLTVV